MTPYSFYVAGASAEIERSERVIAELRRRGHTITLDWPAAIRAEPKKDHELTDDEAHGYAQADIDGVDRAEHVILVTPPRHVVSAGCWVEFEHARWNGNCFAVGPHARASIFTRLPGVTLIECPDEAIVDEVLKRL